MKSRSLSVCIVTRITSDHSFGGMQYYIDRLASGLSDRGNKVYIITTALPNQPRQTTTYKKRGNITTCFLGGTRPGSYRNGFFRKAYNQFCAVNQNKNFDIVHSQSAAGYGFRGKISIPFITTLFGVSYSETPYQRLIFPKLKVSQQLYHLAKLPKIAVSMRFMHNTAKTSDATIVISDYSANELKRFNPGLPHGQVTRIYCGVTIPPASDIPKSKLKKKLGINNTLVLSSGRVEVQKGVHILIEAWSKMNCDNATLAVAGDGSYLPVLKKMAEDRGIRNVVFLGSLPYDQFTRYFAAADLFVYPELTHPAFGLVAAEAMSYGTPVIGSRHGAIPEVIGDAGLLFNPGDSDDLKDQLEYMLSDTETLDYLSKKSGERVSAFFSSDEMVRQTLELYWKHIKRKRRHA